MSFLADYHGPRTRSRAMSIHQTSVYVGTAGGWFLGGWLGELYGWRSPFWVLGVAGTAYAVALGAMLIEPIRRLSEPGEPIPQAAPAGDAHAPDSEAWLAKVGRILSNPAAVMLLGVFVGANFVAAAFLVWLPSFIFRYFQLGLSSSSLVSAFWPLASLPGALCGGVLADWAARRAASGRILVQSLGLVLGVPFVFLTGGSTSVPMLIAGLVGAGLCKGIYDANIFASLYDVVAPADRGTAAGLMNSVGWTGGFLAPLVVGIASDSESLSLRRAITSTAAVYLLVGLLALRAARLASARTHSPRSKPSPRMEDP
jgi:MFS family permease